MHAEMNRKTSDQIAETIRPWSSTNDCKALADRIFTALQIAEKRGQVVEKHKSNRAICLNSEAYQRKDNPCTCDKEGQRHE